MNLVVCFPAVLAVTGSFACNFSEEISPLAGEPSSGGGGATHAVTGSTSGAEAGGPVEGSPCTASEPEPCVLARVTEAISGLAADPALDRVVFAVRDYWLAAGSIQQLTVARPTAPSALGVQQGAPFAPQIAGADVVWLEYAAPGSTGPSVVWLPPSSTQVALMSGITPYRLAIDDRRAYWTQILPRADVIWTCPLEDCRPQQLASDLPIYTLRAAGDRLVWAAEEVRGDAATARIRKCAPSDCVPEDVVGPHPLLHVVSALEGSTIFLNRDKAVLACELDDCAASERLVVDDVSADALATDDGWLYLLTQGTVAKCEQRGCAAPTLLAHSQHSTYGDQIAIVGEYVVWTNAYDGTVNRVAK